MTDKQLDDLRRAGGFWYLGTPYSRYPGGTIAAFEEAARAAAWLVRRGVSVYCPIAHTHPIAVYGDINPFDHEIWLSVDRPMMVAAVGLIVCLMESWEQSRGLMAEQEFFQRHKRPIVFMEWPL